MKVNMMWRKGPTMFNLMSDIGFKLWYDYQEMIRDGEI